MFNMKDLKVAELLVGNNTRDRKDFIGLHLQDDELKVYLENRNAPLIKLELRQAKDWQDEELINTDNVVYLRVHRFYKKKPVGDFTWEYPEGYEHPEESNFNIKHKSEPEAKLKSSIKPKSKPEPNKETKYGFVEFLAEFFTEWTRRRALR